jgi:hypothetical protein
MNDQQNGRGERNKNEYSCDIKGGNRIMSRQFDIDRFDHCPAKEWLHDNMYKYAATRMKSDALIVSGPAVERHIEHGLRIARTEKARVYLIENDPDVYREMKRRFLAIPNKPAEWIRKVKIVHGDVASYETFINRSRPMRFEDLDLCKSMKSLHYLLGHRLLLQSKLAGHATSLRKCFMFTVSLRNCPFDDTFKTLSGMLEDILGVKSSYWPGSCARYKKVNVKEFYPYIGDFGRLLKGGLHLYTYKDGAPMMTGMIFYV